jgi:hypothetical protein
MTDINRNVLVRIHLVIAAFLFPAAIMFALTGALYTWGITGSYDTEQETLVLERPLEKDLERAVGLVVGELQERGLTAPTGSPKIKSAGTSWYLEWTGSSLDVLLEPTAEANAALLSIKTTTFYRQFVQLHKAKGGQLFKAYAALFAIVLFTLLASGFLMAWQMPRYRRTAVNAAALGALLFATVASLS